MASGTIAAPEKGSADAPAESARITPKAPVPDASALKAATKQVDAVYSKDLANARNPGSKGALAKKMIVAGVEEPGGSATRFALLALARDTAAAAEDFETSFAAIDELGKGFQIEASQMKAETVSATARSLRTPGAVGGLITQIDPMIEQALAADRYELALQATESALAAARHVNDRGLIQEATARSQRVKAIEAGDANARKALGVLERDPSNADANLVVGRFRCFVKGDWEHGVPRLAAGSDAALKHVATLDLVRPTTPEVQSELGDAWWGVGGKESGDVKWRILDRAADWYRKALPNLPGLKKLTVEKKLREFAAVPGPDRKYGHELIVLARGAVDRRENGAIVLHDGEKVYTAATFAPPVAFRIVAMTDSTNIRIKYAADQIIFNWEGNPNELRIDGGPAGGRYTAGAGKVPVKAWVEINLVVMPDTMVISVDGKERFRTNADFSQADMPLLIFPVGSIVKVKSIVATRPLPK
ncbi:MAG: hypothetical protein JWN51_692 [Phycisphaerales bacterium]|nr:hypothetical protein [Phycisphaerales bacterium]